MGWKGKYQQIDGNPQMHRLIWPLHTHIWLNLNQCKIQFMVNVLDSGLILDPTLELHLDPLLVAEDMGIGNNEPILRHYEPRATGCRNILAAKRRPVPARQQHKQRAGNSGDPSQFGDMEPLIYQIYLHHSFLRHFTIPSVFSLSPCITGLCMFRVLAIS